MAEPANVTAPNLLMGVLSPSAPRVPSMGANSAGMIDEEVSSENNNRKKRKAVNQADKKRKRKKGRQGRSAETRKRVTEEKERQKEIQRDDFDSFTVCANPLCNDSEIVEDYRTGSVFCRNCGLEDLKQGIFLYRSSTKESSSYRTGEAPFHPPAMKSKPYQRTVHLNQKIANVMGKDPKVPKEDVQRIETYLSHHPDLAGFNIFSAGPKAIGAAVSALRMPKIYSTRWLQIRSKFSEPGIDADVLTAPVVYTINDHTFEEMVYADYWDEVRFRLRVRYGCVSHAFNETIAKDCQFKRSNIITLNYSIPAMLRMESENLFRDYARFFPMTRSDNQPELNNARWRRMVDFCQKNFSREFSFENRDSFKLEWHYTPITTKEVFLFFLRYR